MDRSGFEEALRYRGFHQQEDGFWRRGKMECHFAFPEGVDPKTMEALLLKIDELLVQEDNRPRREGAR